MAHGSQPPRLRLGIYWTRSTTEPPWRCRCHQPSSASGPADNPSPVGPDQRTSEASARYQGPGTCVGRGGGRHGLPDLVRATRPAIPGRPVSAGPAPGPVHSRFCLLPLGDPFAETETGPDRDGPVTHRRSTDSFLLGNVLQSFGGAGGPGTLGSAKQLGCSPPALRYRDAADCGRGPGPAQRLARYGC